MHSIKNLPYPKGKDLVYYFVGIAPYINHITSADIGISVILEDTYIVYIPSKKLDLKINPGDKVVSGSAAHRAMEEKRRITVVSTRATSRFGVPCIATAWPIFNEGGDAIGCIVTSETTDIQEFIKEAANNLKASSQQLTTAIQSLSNHAEHLAHRGQELDLLSKNTVEKVRHTDNILKIIHSLSSKTNLLGLNAAIEAARVGEIGKGFGVVADEVRKLANNSSKSVKEIEAILNSIQASISNMRQQSTDVSSSVEQQVAVIQEIASSSQELSAMAQELLALANTITEAD